MKHKIKDGKIRGVATITLYVWGNSHQELLNQAKVYESILKDHADNNAKVEHLHNTPFGEHCFDNSNEIDLDKLDHNPDVRELF